MSVMSARYIAVGADVSGHAYVRRERRSAEHVPRGSQVFDGEVSFEAGIILEPAN